MVQIDYCEPPTEFDWEQPAVSSVCCDDFPQVRFEEWLSGVGLKWSAETSSPIPTLNEKFMEHAEKWERETGYLSSPTQKMMHPSYQAILGMGKDHEREVVALLIQDMQLHGRSWFGALSYITKDNPIERQDAGKMDRMIGSWAQWAKSKGII